MEVVPQDEPYCLNPEDQEALAGIADAIDHAARGMEDAEDVHYSGPVFAVDAYSTLVVAAAALRGASGPDEGYEVAKGVEHLLRNALELVPAAQEHQEDAPAPWTIACGGDGDQGRFERSGRGAAKAERGVGVTLLADALSELEHLRTLKQNPDPELRDQLDPLESGLRKAIENPVRR